jgi:hypothetical protein
MKMRMGDLRRIMVEARRGRMDTYLRVIEEAPMETAPNPKARAEGASGDSLDQQVDKYINQYEAEAKKTENATGGPNTSQMEVIDWRDLVKGVIIEAGEGDKDSPDGGDAAPGAADMTGEDTDKLTLDDLDVAKFCDDIVRLMENYDSLLEVKNTLQRRARNFLQKNYNDEVLTAFDDVMRDDHGLVVGMDKQGIDDERFPAPPAARASGSAQPGVGGGGGAP